MAWSALDEQSGACGPGAAGDRHGQPDLAQDHSHRVRLGEPESSITDEEKIAEPPHTDKGPVIE